MDLIKEAHNLYLIKHAESDDRVPMLSDAEAAEIREQALQMATVGAITGAEAGAILHLLSPKEQRQKKKNLLKKMMLFGTIGGVAGGAHGAFNAAPKDFVFGKRNYKFNNAYKLV